MNASSTVLQTFPMVYKERGEALAAEERDARLDTPIFVCQLSFPGMPTLLHFFEPRYRLMLRRCLESPSPRFGMIMAPKPGAGSPQIQYGTMLEIRSVQMLPDGRSMVETWGSFRFRILERGTLDGSILITQPPLESTTILKSCQHHLSFSTYTNFQSESKYATDLTLTVIILHSFFLLCTATRGAIRCYHPSIIPSINTYTRPITPRFTFQRGPHGYMSLLSRTPPRRYRTLGRPTSLQHLRRHAHRSLRLFLLGRSRPPNRRTRKGQAITAPKRTTTIIVVGPLD
ncbi:hypothetical protein NP233_g7088 [Leucocoprinus birnbaumii]|uniref:Lon N-terminal domain-containing protein n=1 Tax=Leucocoprinus birnbaumii TaxID=56174 RepID=A0AAD5YQB8_9AGAR|nr:hypothetical protein NP233_g7088 [Leucocoprinus birnbaumii]